MADCLDMNSSESMDSMDLTTLKVSTCVSDKLLQNYVSVGFKRGCTMDVVYFVASSEKL